MLLCISKTSVLNNNKNINVFSFNKDSWVVLMCNWGLESGSQGPQLRRYLIQVDVPYFFLKQKEKNKLITKYLRAIGGLRVTARGHNRGIT